MSVLTFPPLCRAGLLWVEGNDTGTFIHEGHKPPSLAHGTLWGEHVLPYRGSEGRESASGPSSASVGLGQHRPYLWGFPLLSEAGSHSWDVASAWGHPWGVPLLLSSSSLVGSPDPALLYTFGSAGDWDLEGKAKTL